MIAVGNIEKSACGFVMNDDRCFLPAFVNVVIVHHDAELQQPQQGMAVTEKYYG